MLIILSDLHLTDGSTALNVSRAAYKLLADEIADAKQSRAVEDVHLVLLGDIFDLVRTSYWNEGNKPRPWDGELSPLTGMNVDNARNVAQFSAVLARILAHPEVEHGFIPFLTGLPAPARVTYVVGNHDRVFNNYDELKAQLAAALPGVDLQWATSVRAPEYGVAARHGHEYDEICHGWQFSNKVLRPDHSLGRFDAESYNVMALGEVLTAELMSGFIYNLRECFPHATRTDEQKRIIRQLVDVNNLRPTTDVFRWLAWFTRGRDVQYVTPLLNCFSKALGDMLATSFCRRWDEMRDFPIGPLFGDVVDKLQFAKDVLDGVKDNDSLRNATLKLVDVFSGDGETPIEKDELFQAALEEWASLGDNYRYLLFGHTHDALHRCIHAPREGEVSMYVNTGTYLPLIQRSHDGKGYHREHRMSLCFFYQSTEDADGRVGHGPTADIWTGFRHKEYEGGLVETFGGA